MEIRGVIDLLGKLVSINSVNPAYPSAELGEAPLTEYVGDLLKANGIEYVLEEVVDGRKNLIAKIKGKTDRGILFEAHSDTVTVEGMTIPPFLPECRDGLLYGRGSCDTKGSMAAMLWALIRLKREGIVPATDVYFAAAADEEYQARGAKKMVENGFRAGSVVVGEATSLNIVIACKGVARFRITASGVSAHSARPQEGVSAISKIAKLINAIDGELVPHYNGKPHPALGTPTINVGVVSGGKLVNIVPDECHIDIDRRILPGETYESVTDEVIQLAKAHGLTGISLKEQLLFDEAMETAESSPLVRSARAIANALGLDDQTYGVSYCCDGTKFSRAGMDTIILGPGDIKHAHTACEFVPIKECELASEMYFRLCQSKELA